MAHRAVPAGAPRPDSRRARGPADHASRVDRWPTARHGGSRRPHGGRALPARRAVLPHVRRVHRRSSDRAVLRHARFDDLPALFVLGGDGFAGFGGFGHALLVILLGIVIHLIESNFVIPLITAKKVELPPVLTIMSVLVVGSLLGPVGLLVAVPTLAVVMVVLRRILINRIYEGHGFRRASRDRALVLRVPAPEGGVLVTDAPELDIIAEPARAA